jgi:hypothetical protein
MYEAESLKLKNISKRVFVWEQLQTKWLLLILAFSADISGSDTIAAVVVPAAESEIYYRKKEGIYPYPSAAEGFQTSLSWKREL